MFLDKLKKILFGEAPGSIEQRYEKPSVYAPGKGINERIEEPSNIIVVKESLISPTTRNLLLFGIFIGVILITASFIYRFIRFDNSKIQLEISGAQSIPAGKPFAFKLRVINRNRKTIDNTFLNISVPQELLDFKSKDSEIEKTNEGYKILLGTIQKNNIKELNFEALILGPKDKGVEFNFAFNFRNPLSLDNTVITKGSDFIISGDPIDFSISREIPTIVYNQEAKFSLNYNNKTDIDLSNLKIELSYPINFQTFKFSLAPSSANNVWILNSLSQGMQGKIDISGIFDFIENQKGASIEGKVYFINQRNEQIVIARNLLKFSIEEPPLLLSLATFKFLIDKNALYTSNVFPIENPFTEIDGVNRGEKILVRIKIKNTSQVPIEDIKIQTGLNLDNREIAVISPFVFTQNINDPLLYKTKEFIDPDSKYNLKIFDFGSFSGSGNMISWDKFSYPALAILNPNETKEASFIIRIKDKIDPTNNNQEIKSLINIGISSGKIPVELAGLTLEDHRAFALKLNTDLGVTTDIVKDSPYFTNYGRVPMQELVKSTFVVGLKIFNSFNNLSNFVLKAKPNYFIDFEAGPYPKTEKLYYDNLANEIVWKVDKILPGNNYYGKGDIVYFQVSITPTKDLPYYYDIDTIQRGLYKPIVFLQNIRIEANDNFLNKKIGFTLPDITYLTYIIK